jgi:hypothetical protein
MTLLAAASRRPAERTLPPIFDRLVVVLTVQAHLFGLFVMVSNRHAYRSFQAELVVWLVSFLIPLVGLGVALRTGGVLSGGAFALAALALAGVDVGCALLVPRSQVGGEAMWNWSVLGVSVLTLVPFRPVRDIIGLTAVHGLATIGCLAWGAGQGSVTAYVVVWALNGALLPALAAAQFVGLYLNAVRSRQRAAAQELTTLSATLAAGAVQLDTERRLTRLRDETVPLLRAVASGEVSPSDPRNTELARRLSGDLRRELLESRSGTWFLEALEHSVAGGGPGAEQDEGADGGSARSAPDLFDPRHCLERLSETDRASLAVLIQSLRRGREWDRVSVTLAPQTHGYLTDRFAEQDATAAELLVIALGAPARAATGDLVVQAAAARLGAVLASESAHILTADATVRFQPVTTSR